MSSIAKQVVNVGPGGIIGGEELEPFPAPAREPAYQFEVTVYCSCQPMRRWRGARWPAQQDELARAYHLIRGTVRQVAVQFSIFEPGAAEREMNERLADMLKDAHLDRTLSLSWTARAEVALPRDVLRLMRDAVADEYKIQATARVTELRMVKTNELREGWDRFLNEAAQSPNAQHAVHLAEDSADIAETLAKVLEARRAGAKDLLTIIDNILEAHRSADILDLVVRSETVLHHTLKMMGIPIPDLDPDNLLVPVSDET